MANAQTDSAFVRRLAAAASAGWFCFLLGVFVLVCSGAIFLWITNIPVLMDAISQLWGVDQVVVHVVWIGFIGTMKFFLLVWMLGCVFLSVWARRLRAAGDS